MLKSPFLKLAVVAVVILTVAGVGYAGLMVWLDRVRTETKIQGSQPISRNEFVEDGPTIKLPAPQKSSPLEGVVPLKQSQADEIFSQSPLPRFQNKSLTLAFSGEVLRGQNFEKEIGSGLLFQLVPVKDGWDIWIGNKANRNQDFSFITPPFSGMNDRNIYGWHFIGRNRDSRAPNPGYERFFAFVLNQESYLKVAETFTMGWPLSEKLQDIYWPTDEEQGEGVLTISRMQLGNVGKDMSAWIDFMRFESKIYLPSTNLE